VKDYYPLIRLRKNFMVKSIEQASSLDCRTDLEFVTFLRHILTLGREVNTSTSICHQGKRCAEWIDQEQSIFKINNRDEFAMEWYEFKVIFSTILFCQGLEFTSWDFLYTSVITEFISRNILKQLFSDSLIFQVFCIKQLLK
jgi:hypothetical protein